ncbi:MAG TPA: hypothetical protein VK670_12730 [Silvibacterium sp.]|nr:hypothetical protein [Silvibacterium sp.]
MKPKLAVLTCVGLTVFAVNVARSQTVSEQPADHGSGKHAKPAHNEKHSRSAGGEMASGAGDIGKGVGKGAGSLAVGTGKGAVDLATLHPIDAATDIGKGGAKAGTHIAVGTVKGTGKVVTGVGKGIKHIF